MLYSLRYVLNIEEIKELQETFQNNSVLKCTYEVNINDKIPFLDELIEANNNNCNTSVYKKNILVMIHAF